MNGYKALADVYKDGIEDLPEETREKVLHKIKALDFLATACKEDIYALFDSSAFNDIVRGYLSRAINITEIDPEDGKKLREELHYLFDDMTAEEAEDYYRTH